VIRRMLLVSCAALLVACTKGEPELRADDRPELKKIVEQDVRASKAMHAADDAASKGDAKAALEAVETQARPAIDEGLRLADAAALKTAWARARRDAIAAVLRERKNELPRYTEAVTSGDPEKLLSAIEAQASIERRALAAVEGVAATDEGR
jgi:hypothetical protein